MVNKAQPHLLDTRMFTVCKVTRQAPNASKNHRWRVYVTVSVASWRVKLFYKIIK